MIKKIDKNAGRLKRRLRVKFYVKGTADKPRLNVYRSTSHIYVQVINDEIGATLASCSSLDSGLKAALKGKNKQEQAKIVGAEAGKRALAAGINQVVFDRSGYLYIGRVKQVADGAREAGLKF